MIFIIYKYRENVIFISYTVWSRTVTVPLRLPGYFEEPIEDFLKRAWEEAKQLADEFRSKFNLMVEADDVHIMMIYLLTHEYGFEKIKIPLFRGDECQLYYTDRIG